MSIHRHPVLLWVLALLLAVGFAGLGRWQLGRQVEKRVILDAVAAVLAERRASPATVVGDPVRSGSYDWTILSGHFVQAPAVLLDNQRRGDQVGVRVYRAFQPAPEATGLRPTALPPMLVELGWLPLPPDRRMPQVPLPGGGFRREGLLLPPPGSGLTLGPPATDAQGHLLVTGLHPQALAAPMGLTALAPRVLRPPPEFGFGADAPAYLRDFDILPNTLPPERHLGYAVQWFALSATVLIVAVVLTLRRRATRGTEPELPA